MFNKQYRFTLLVGFWCLALIALLYPFVTDIDPSSDSVSVGGQPVPNFARFDVISEKKQAFFRYLAPAIEAQNERILQQRHFILSLQDVTDKDQLSKAQQKQFAQLLNQYRVDEELDFSQQQALLIRRVDIIPMSLVLVQAANESAWGTSRFARKGFNFFGLWCYRKGCGFVPKRRDEGAKHEVAKFNQLEAAVATYLTNLNRHPAYSELRLIRQSLREQGKSISAEDLTPGLRRYSERGQAYVDELLAMLNSNKKYMRSL